MIRFRLTSTAALLGALLISPLALAQEPPKPADNPPKPQYEIVVEDLFGTDDLDQLVLVKEQDEPKKEGIQGAGHTQAFTLRSSSTPQLRTIYRRVDPLMNQFGLSLAEADDALRAQLEIPPGEGVVVVSVKADSLADHAGLKVNDLLLTLGGAPAKDVAGVQKTLLALTREAIPVKLVREGKRTQLSVVGPEHGFAPEPTEYWIGVPVSPVDATLRAHLPSLAADTGLVANDVVKGSPAEKAKIEKNDILVAIDGKPLKDVQGMIALIQASEGKSISIETLRAGKPNRVNLVPEKRKAGRGSVSVTKTPFVTSFTYNGDRQVVPPPFAVEIDGKSADVDALTRKLKGAVESKVGSTMKNVKIDMDEKHAEWAKLVGEQVQNEIQLRLQTKKLTDLQSAAQKLSKQAEFTTDRADRLESKLKELSTKLDEIQSLLKELKPKPEAK